MNNSKIGIFILRVGMAGVYLYFGYSQLKEGDKWLTVVPDWAVELFRMSAEQIVMGNGILEIALGLLLLLGMWARPVALISAIHLFVIAATLGFTPNGVRDAGLALATLSLAFFPKARP